MAVEALVEATSALSFRRRKRGTTYCVMAASKATRPAELKTRHTQSHPSGTSCVVTCSNRNVYAPTTFNTFAMIVPTTLGHCYPHCFLRELEAYSVVLVSSFYAI